MRGLMERKRRRKRGSAKPVRAYNHHLNLRLTYYEAYVLHRMLAEPEVKLNHYDASAATRVRSKVALAAEFDQREIQKANMTRRLAKLKAKVKAQEASGIRPDCFVLIDIECLESRLADGEYRRGTTRLEDLERVKEPEQPTQ